MVKARHAFVPVLIVLVFYLIVLVFTLTENLRDITNVGYAHLHRKCILAHRKTLCALMVAMVACSCGCIDSNSVTTGPKVWSRRGLDDGRFHKPRAIAIDKNDRLYIVDMTARVQVFDSDQNFVRFWRTPEFKFGKPCGLTFAKDDVLMVADTHYHRVLFYTPAGELLPDRTIGGTLGLNEGEFGYVTDVVQDSAGCYYVSEYGEFDRIQKFDTQGNFVYQWGGRGSEPGQFLRPQGLAMDAQDQIWIADASNHRIQVFDVSGEAPHFVKQFGSAGTSAGQIRYPYDIVLYDNEVFVCEFGNHRVQRFSREGESLGLWGMPGREPGEFHQPWAMTIDTTGRMHVLDSYNHRVQTMSIADWDWPLETQWKLEDE